MVSFETLSSSAQYSDVFFTVIQLAKLSGFSPIITTASLHNEALVKSLGATHIVDRKADVVAEVKKLTDKPIEVIYDAISDKVTQRQAWEILAPGGTLILVGAAEVDKDKYKDKHTVGVFGSVHTQELRKLGVSLFSKLTQLLENGDIKVCRYRLLLYYSEKTNVDCSSAQQSRSFAERAGRYSGWFAKIAG